MSLAELVTVLPPPTPLAPREVDTDWGEVAETLFTELPSDFIAFIERYGAGCINDFLWPFSPFTANPRLELINQGRLQVAGLLTLREMGGLEEVPYTLYPEDDGLLTWGVTNYGDMLLWQTAGLPEAWSVVVAAGGEPLYEFFDMPVTAFLTGLLRGTLVCRLFPDDVFGTGRATFTPAGPNSRPRFGRP